MEKEVRKSKDGGKIGSGERRENWKKGSKEGNFKENRKEEK